MRPVRPFGTRDCGFGRRSDVLRRGGQGGIRAFDHTVERSADGGETWSVVAQGLERSGYVDAGLASGEAYQYRVSEQPQGQQRPGQCRGGVHPQC